LQNHYDYIITGSGAAGLSLLLHMQQFTFFNSKKILVIDNNNKNQNDRTWCFWEKNESILEAIVYKKWEQLQVNTASSKTIKPIAPYTYKMIRAIDFYNHAKKTIASNKNIVFLNATVSSVTNKGNGVVVVANNETFYANFAFNSIIFQQPNVSSKQNLLLQHFKGFVITTTNNSFNPSIATFMDFNVSQKHGTTFVYVLPFNQNTALVEYTLFTKNKLTDVQYNEGLNDYINNNLGITNFTIDDEETGVIPMTDAKFEKANVNIINIGTVSGATRASTGYTFQFIQKQCNAICKQLIQNQHPATYKSVISNKAKFYDKILLEVLAKNKVQGSKVFGNIFQQCTFQQLFAFLDDESSFANDLNIILSQPKLPFIKAFFAKL
jgi:lycopene beta-cyclase